MDYVKDSVNGMIDRMIDRDEKFYDYMGCTKKGFERYKELIDNVPDLKYIEVDKILVNETTHTQYFFNKNYPELLKKILKDKIKDLREVAEQLEEGLWEVNFISADDETKKLMMRKKKIEKLLNF